MLITYQDINIQWIVVYGRPSFLNPWDWTSTLFKVQILITILTFHTLNCQLVSYYSIYRIISEPIDPYYHVIRANTCASSNDKLSLCLDSINEKLKLVSCWYLHRTPIVNSRDPSVNFSLNKMVDQKKKFWHINRWAFEYG